MDNQLLRAIPKVDDMTRAQDLGSKCREISGQIVTAAVRNTLERLRKGIIAGEITAIPQREKLLEEIVQEAHKLARPGLCEVVNGTGVVLHTNLGRACISERAAARAAVIAKEYSTLEYDIAEGRRGVRDVYVEEQLCRLTGAESAMAVNNNAAAVLLILSAIAQGGEVITSRGELVEIGGGFRVPDIMESCGAFLREVGTTNKTHLYDYECAIGDTTRALMKVHTSNYRIVGFSESVPLDELVSLAHRNGLPVIEDLGSGCLVNMAEFGIYDEPTVADSVRAGIDVLSFSGDKLLGGPQAGIILGKKAIIEKLRRHPLARAMRLDKMTLAALEATLCAYLDGTAIQEIPVLRMLAVRPEELRARAQILCDMLAERGVHTEILEVQGQVGGGSAPMQRLKSYAVAVNSQKMDVNQLEEKLRIQNKPIIGRIANDRYVLDVRTLRREDYEYIAAAIVRNMR